MFTKLFSIDQLRPLIKEFSSDSIDQTELDIKLLMRNGSVSYPMVNIKKVFNEEGDFIASIENEPSTAGVFRLTGLNMDPHDTFPQRVWHIVASIPEGYVATYGDVARLAGSPRAARQVGGVLKRLPEGSTLPWHRVVNRHGDISLTGPDLQRQRQALLAEGVQVSGSGHIDLQHYRWVY